MKPSIDYISQRPNLIRRVHELLEKHVDCRETLRDDELHRAILACQNLIHPRVIHKEFYMQQYLWNISPHYWQLIWEGCSEDEREQMFESEKYTDDNPRRSRRQRKKEGYYQELEPS